MVRIRLVRIGLKRQPEYRVVVTDKRKARNGKYIEVIGHHNPRTRPALDLIDDERALYWLSVGAQPSEAARRVMDRTGTMERFERLRNGEDMQALVEEALAAKENAEPISLRTRYPSPAPGQGKNASAAAAELVEDTEETDDADEVAPEAEVEEAVEEEMSAEDTEDTEEAAEE